MGKSRWGCAPRSSIYLRFVTLGSLGDGLAVLLLKWDIWFWTFSSLYVFTNYKLVHSSSAQFQLSMRINWTYSYKLWYLIAIPYIKLRLACSRREHGRTNFVYMIRRIRNEGYARVLRRVARQIMTSVPTVYTIVTCLHSPRNSRSYTYYQPGRYYPLLANTYVWKEVIYLCQISKVEVEWYIFIFFTNLRYIIWLYYLHFIIFLIENEQNFIFMHIYSLYLILSLRPTICHLKNSPGRMSLKDKWII